MMVAFAALLFAYVLSQFYRAFLAVIASELARDLGLGAAGLGNLSAIWFITFALAQFPVGMALDRLGPRRTVSGLFLIAVLGSAGFAMAENYAQAAAAMALIGIGCSPILMGSLYYFGRTAPPERFALLGSMMVGFGSLGNLLGAAPLAWAAASIGWRASMMGIAVATALSAVIIYVCIRDPERLHGKGQPNDGLLAGLGAIARLTPIQLMAPLVLVSYAAVAALRSLWVAPFFGQVHGFDVTERGNAALIMAAAMSLGALAYGPLERRLGGAKNTVLLGTVIATLSLVGLAGFGDRSANAALVMYAILGFSGMTYPILLAHSRLFFPPHLLGRGVTAMNFLSIGGAGLLQWISGNMVETMSGAGWAQSSTYAALHGGFAAILVLGTLTYLITPARPDKPPR